MAKRIRKVKNILNKSKSETHSTQNIQIQFGDIFYSEYYGSKAVVVNVDGDDWYFVLYYVPDRVIKAEVSPNEVEWIRRG